MQVHCELPTKREFTPTDDSSLSPSAAEVWFSLFPAGIESHFCIRKSWQNPLTTQHELGKHMNMEAVKHGRRN